MNPQQSEYIQKNYHLKSAKEIAKELGMDPKKVRRIIKSLPESAQTERANHEVSRPGSPWDLRTISFLGLVLILTAALYFRTLSYPFSDWDDPDHVIHNTAIREINPESLKSMLTTTTVGLYIPLTVLSFAVDYQLYHLDARGYHITNVAIHLINTLLVAVLVIVLTREWILGLAVALIFGIHPLQTESVIWITERKNLLSAFFFLISFMAFVFSGRNKRHFQKFLFLSIIAFIAACLAKPSVVVLPLILVAHDLCFGKFEKKRLFVYLPYFVLAAVSALVVILASAESEKLNYHGGSFKTSTLTMTVVMMKYFQLMIFPLKQKLIYILPAYGSIFAPAVALSSAALLALGGAMVLLWKRNRHSLFWILWYFIILLPVMNMIPFPSIMNERYLYLPLVGFFALIFGYLNRIFPKAVFLTLMLLCASGYAALNFNRQEVWSSPEKMWQDVQRRSPSKIKGKYSITPFVNQGLNYLQQDKPDAAMEEFLKGLAVHEDDMLYTGIGTAYFQKGDYPKAEYYLRKVIQGDPAKPTKANLMARTFLARVYEEERQYDRAIREIQALKALDPVERVIYPHHLARVLEKAGQEEQAEQEYQKALEMDPHHAPTLYNLGFLYWKQGHNAKARALWQTFVTYHSDHEKAPEIRSKLNA